MSRGAAQPRQPEAERCHYSEWQIQRFYHIRRTRIADRRARPVPSARAGAACLVRGRCAGARCAAWVITIDLSSIKVKYRALVSLQEGAAAVPVSGHSPHTHDTPVTRPQPPECCGGVCRRFLKRVRRVDRRRRARGRGRAVAGPRHGTRGQSAEPELGLWPVAYRIKYLTLIRLGPSLNRSRSIPGAPPRAPRHPCSPPRRACLGS